MWLPSLHEIADPDTEAYSGPCQTSMIECSDRNNCRAFTIICSTKWTFDRVLNETK